MMDYKAKYKELKAKMIENTDLAYRLGFEKGMQQAQQQAQADQMMQMQQAMMQPQIDPATGQLIQGGQPGQPGSAPGADPMAAAGGMPGAMPGAAPGGMPMDPNAMDPAAQMGGQFDLEPGAQDEMDQYINELEELVAKGEKPSVIEVRKRVEAITTLRKSQKAKMKDNQPKVIAAQKSLVNNILKKWEKETKVTAENLEDVLKETGLKIE